jgi:hypothetical protein
MSFNYLLVNDIHHFLKGTGGICEAEKHYQRFPVSEFGFECCFPLVPFLDMDVVISLSHINFRKDVCTTQV